MSYYFRNKNGFTLTELTISIAIVSVILTVVILNQSTYTETVALTNLADEIGLTISQAQTYGIGVRELSTGSSDFSAAYGLAFSLLASGSNSAYIYFADRPVANKIYDGNWTCPIGGTSECLGKTDISRGNVISSLCAVINGGPDQCNIGRVDISFARPSTEASILFFDLSGGATNPANMKGAKVVLTSPGGKTRSVTVYMTGQISIQ
jgi:prepilin-type N-terminal cleavage/methylation domain-containing protein